MSYLTKSVIGAIISLLVYFILIFESDEELYYKQPIDTRLRGLNYPIERHYIITEDKYNITLFRLGRKGSSNFNKGKPVVFVPQFLNCIDSYVSNEEHLAPGLVFANHGFDVWFMSTRGGEYSPNDDKNEGFSFHELGYYDLSKTFEYVYSINPQNVSAIGHSQGGNTILAALAERRLKNADKIIIFGSGIYATQSQGLFPLFLNSTFVDILAQFTDKLNLGPSRFLFYFTKHFHFLSRLFFHYVIDTLDSEMNISKLYNFAKHSPQPSSMKNLVHFKQIFNRGEFVKFDYGVEKNNQIYGQPIPPLYDLMGIQESLHLFYGAHDILTRHPDTTNFYELMKQSQARNVTFSLYPSIGHISFILDKKGEFLKEMISIIESN